MAAAAAARRKVLAAADGCCLLLLLDAHWPKQLDNVHSLLQYIGGVGSVSNMHTLTIRMHRISR